MVTVTVRYGTAATTVQRTTTLDRLAVQVLEKRMERFPSPSPENSCPQKFSDVAVLPSPVTQEGRKLGLLVDFGGTMTADLRLIASKRSGSIKVKKSGKTVSKQAREGTTVSK